MPKVEVRNARESLGVLTSLHARHPVNHDDVASAIEAGADVSSFSRQFEPLELRGIRRRQGLPERAVPLALDQRALLRRERRERARRGAG